MDGFLDAIIIVTIQGVDSDNDLVSGTNGNDILNGGLGNDQITDDRGADRLNGDSGDDDLTSGRNNDILDGGTGADVMRGGTGNDQYFVDDAADQVIELANEGTDLVEASGAFTFVLPTNVENLNLIGDTDGSGNGADNRTCMENARQISAGSGTWPGRGFRLAVVCRSGHRGTIAIEALGLTECATPSEVPRGSTRCKRAPVAPFRRTARAGNTSSARLWNY